MPTSRTPTEMSAPSPGPAVESIRAAFAFARPLQLEAISERCGVPMSTVRQWRARQSLDELAGWITRAIAGELGIDYETGEPLPPADAPAPRGGRDDRDVRVPRRRARRRVSARPDERSERW